MWKKDTKPTRANVDKRLLASLAAIESADDLLKQMPADQNVMTATHHAGAWVADARRRLNANSGKKGKR